MAKIPAYRRVYSALKQQLKEQLYPVGTLLPTESELEEKFGFSRTTIRKAISLLAADGYLNVRQGKGTEVLDVSTTQRLNCITSITETLRAKGCKVTTQGIFIQKVRPPEPAAAALELPEDSLVYQVQRVQCADGRPIAIMNNYLRESAVPGLEQYSGSFVGLYGLLEDRYHLVLHHAQEYLSAVAADFTESQILQVEVGAPLLCSRRITYTEQGPLEYSIIKLLADKYEYVVYLQGRK